MRKDRIFLTISILLLFLVGGTIDRQILVSQSIGIPMIIEGKVDKETDFIYKFKIDNNLKKEDFEIGVLIMGVVLEGLENEQCLDMEIYKSIFVSGIGWVDDPLVGWRENSGQNRGSIIVEPGEEYVIKIQSKNGEVKFRLRLLKPGSVCTFQDKNRDNEIGNYVFFKLINNSEKTANDTTLYSYVPQDMTQQYNGKLYFYKGNQTDFLHGDVNTAIQIREFADNNFLVLRKEGKYFINDEMDYLERVKINENFNRPQTINKGEEHHYEEIRFTTDTKYILLVVTDPDPVYLSMKLYSTDDRKNINILRESILLMPNIFILYLDDGIDFNSSYRLVVESSRLDMPVSYRMTQSVTGHFREIVHNLTTITNANAVFNNYESTEELWFVFETDVTGLKRFVLQWENTQLDSVSDLKMSLYYNGDIINFYQSTSNSMQDEKEITFYANNPNAIYLLKITRSPNILYKLKMSGVLSSSIEVSKGIGQAESMLEILTSLYANGNIISEEVNSLYKKLLINPEYFNIKYQILDLLVNKHFREMTLSKNAFLNYFSKLMTNNEPEEIVGLMIEIYKDSVIDINVFSSLYRKYLEILGLNQTINIELLTLFNKQAFSEEMLKQSFEEYLRLKQNTLKIKEFALFLFENEIIKWDDWVKYKFMGISEHDTLELAYYVYDNLTKMTMDDFNNYANEFKIVRRELQKGVELEEHPSYQIIISKMAQNSNLRVLTTYIKPSVDITVHSEKYHSVKGTEKNKKYNEDDEIIAIINGGFFNMSNGDMAGQAIVDGLDNTPGGVQQNPACPDSIYRYFWGIEKDSSRFVFGQLVRHDSQEIIKGEPIVKTFGVIPYETYKQLQWGISGVGTLISNGVNTSKDNIGKFIENDLRRTTRTAIGVSENQELVYLFYGSAHTPNEIANIFLQRSVYNAQFMDSGGSAQMLYRDRETVTVLSPSSTGLRRPIPNSIVLLNKKGQL